MKADETGDIALLRNKIIEALAAAYETKRATVGAEIMRYIEKEVMLRTLDQHWREHLAAMDYMRQGIFLRSYAQKNPKQEYKREAFELFAGMLDRIKFDTVTTVSKVQVRSQAEIEREELERQQRLARALQLQHAEAVSPIQVGNGDRGAQRWRRRQSGGGNGGNPSGRTARAGRRRRPRRSCGRSRRWDATNVSLRVGQEVQALSRRLAASERLTESPSSAAHGLPAIHVAAAVLIDRRGRILIAQRPAGKHLAGSWEFPGGKIEPGETRTTALARELKEELGVTIERPRPLLRLRHAYPYGEVLLDVWVVRRYRGEPRGLDGQALQWCSHRELSDAELLPADRPIVEALRLPERLRHAASPFYEILTCERFRRRARSAVLHIARPVRCPGSSGSGRPPRLRGLFMPAVERGRAVRRRGGFSGHARAVAAR